MPDYESEDYCIMSQRDYTYVYLAGPLSGCSDDEAFGWRKYVMENLKRQIVQKTPLGEDISIPKADFYFLTPMLRDYRHLNNDHQGITAVSPEIVQLDKRDIDMADVVFVKTPRPSYGTAMEMIYAWERGKVVVAVVEEEAPLSPWVAFHSTTVQYSLDAAIEWIVKNVR